MPVPNPNAPSRILNGTSVRTKLATDDKDPPAPAQNPNSDESLFDKVGTYSKGLKQDGKGLVNPAAFQGFRTVIDAAEPIPGAHDFSVVMMGGGRKLNGPQGAFAAQLTCKDSAQFGTMTVPEAPGVGSPEYAVELVELYWASLLRDVPFAEYEANPIAIAAAAELNIPAYKDHYAGPLDAHGNVTPRVLFRGGFNKGSSIGPLPKNSRPKYFAGELTGPHLSQFCFVPTNFGAQPIDQKYYTAAPHVDYMTDPTVWELVQEGKSADAYPLNKNDRRHLHSGRGLCVYTHEDELYQAYFTAYLVMKTMGIPLNATSPYRALNPDTKFKNEQPFGTFGGADIAATLAAVAKAALNAVWYQKWVIHLRHRPESGGGILHYQRDTMHPTSYSAAINHLAINSNAVVRSMQHNSGSDLLSQAFPEGSPTHPAYPTGHGCVAGACITALKFFYKGDTIIPNPVVPTADGMGLMPYVFDAGDTGVMNVNGELHKLAHNISFGHGLHAGIHWRSDTDYSMLLGEEVAVNFLEEQVKSYSEKVSVTIDLMDGQTQKTFAN